MSIVRINALDVPPEMAETLEQRFATRAGEVETMDGFESFELLRPTDGSNRYFVYTRWRDEAAFDAWVSSRQFQHGHARAGGDPDAASDDQQSSDQQPDDQQSSGGHGGAAAPGSELLAFEVVLAASSAGSSVPIGSHEEE